MCNFDVGFRTTLFRNPTSTSEMGMIMTVIALCQRLHHLPAGFRAGSVVANIKYRDRLDLTLLVSDTDCAAAGVFTRAVRL